MKTITHERWKKLNKQVAKVAREHGLKFTKTYGYYGPKTKRVKLWDVDPNVDKAEFLSMCYWIASLPYVSDIKVSGWAKKSCGCCSSPLSLYVKYN